MARKTGAVNHTHKYFQRDDGLWACSGVDGCTHYMPRNMKPLPTGLMSMCWGNCEKAFQLTPYSMRNKKPMCDTCEEALDVIGGWIEENEAKAKTIPKPKPKGLAALTMLDEEIEVIEGDDNE